MTSGEATKMVRKSDGGGASAKKTGERVLFVSLFMILLAFFILLNALAHIQEEKQRDAIKSLGGAFGHMPSGLSIFDTAKPAPNLPGPAVQVEEVERRFVRQLRRMFTGELGAGAKVRPAATGNGAVIEISSPSVFSGRDTDLPRPLADRVRRLGDLVQASKVDVTVKGYTNLRLDSSIRDAWFVSGRRAQNVVRLMHQRGVDLDRVRLEGFGDMRPAAAEYSREGRRKNERVQIHLQIEDGSNVNALFPNGGIAAPISGQAG